MKVTEVNVYLSITPMIKCSQVFYDRRDAGKNGFVIYKSMNTLHKTITYGGQTTKKGLKFMSFL